MSSELEEYQQWVKSRPRYLKPDEVMPTIVGFLTEFGVRDEYISQIEYDRKERVVFFPFLDPYWFRAGRVWEKFSNLSETRLMPLRVKLAACIREAERKDEIHILFKPTKGVQHRERLKHLGGTCD